MERWVALGVIANNLLVLARAEAVKTPRSGKNELAIEIEEDRPKVIGASGIREPFLDKMLTRAAIFAPGRS